ncbi:hypothetical protein [Actinomadura sp. 7K534]|uniref:hypothetical protein n=1 Tax=Actinomadura sp. 7K534 TaxID=2530366 RepID=UPI0010480210|nr:hypothetical protein [Actinomadura sp. 7K534]TDB87483.1 hypothetical protein E1266_32665 [Actinomadura sp. 7K534]
MSAVLALLALLLTGCGSASGAGGAEAPARPGEQLRQTIGNGLLESGKREEARIVRLDGTRLIPVDAPVLRSWKIYRVDHRQGPHPALLHVALGHGRVELLTGAPDAFGKVMAADGGTVEDTATAVALARVYVETTRPGGILTYVVGRVEDIRFRPGITGDDARHRDEIVAEYGPRIKAPVAVANGKKGFTATVFVVRDEALRRHDLKVSPKGAIEDEVKTLVPDLPVPYTF